MSTIAHRNIALHTWINFVSGITFLVPVVTLLYKHTDLGIAEIILIANASTLCIWLFELPTSVFADTVGGKKALVISVICNLVSASFLLFFQNFLGFIIASVFAGLYFSFWSGTGQAFLEENLRILGKEKEYGKYIGKLMAYSSIPGIIIPLISSGILYLSPEKGFWILAAIDVISASILVMMTLLLRDVGTYTIKFESFSHLLKEQFTTAKKSLLQVFRNPKLFTILLYRSFTNHVAFFAIILLPILTKSGMPEYYSGYVLAIGSILTVLVYKYMHHLGDHIGYTKSWMVATISQACLLIVAGFLLQSWLLVAIIYVFFSALDGIWQPAWNHVLVENTDGKNTATIRSIIFSVFALYTTIGKQIASFFPVGYSLIGIGVVILVANVFLRKRVFELQKS